MHASAIRNYLLAANVAFLLGVSSCDYRPTTSSVEKGSHRAQESEMAASIRVREGIGAIVPTTQEDAERSLDALARDPKVTTEDAWMFHADTLMDIGLYERPGSVTVYDLPICFAIRDAQAGDTLFLYHIHPSSSHRYRLSPPSGNDFRKHAALKEQFAGSGVTLIARMFDGEGCWEFDLEEDIIRELNAENRREGGTYARLDSLIDEKTSDPYGKTIGIEMMMEPYAPTRVEEYIESMRKFGVRLAFTPSEELWR
jgi:hypothetical protein